MSQNDSCYNYTALDPNSFTVYADEYSGIFSTNKMTPYYATDRLDLVSNIWSTSHEKSINSYFPDPDIQRTDSSGGN